MHQRVRQTTESSTGHRASSFERVPTSKLARARVLSALAVGLFAALAFASGCSNGDGVGAAGTSDAGDPMDGFVVCPQPGDQIDMYRANLVKAGSRGKLTFMLVQSDNAPPIKGKNNWQLKITRADMSPVTGEVVPDVKMPKHVHPAGEQPVLTYEPALGLYTANPVYFFMTGYWRAQFTAYETSEDAGDPLDSAAFYFCVE